MESLRPKSTKSLLADKVVFKRIEICLKESTRQNLVRINQIGMIFVNEVKGAIERATITATQFINLNNAATTIADEFVILPIVKTREYESDIKGWIIRAFKKKKMAIRRIAPNE